MVVGSLPPEFAETLGEGTAPGIPQAIPRTGGPDVLLFAAFSGFCLLGAGAILRRLAP